MSPSAPCSRPSSASRSASAVVRAATPATGAAPLPPPALAQPLGPGRGEGCDSGDEARPAAERFLAEAQHGLLLVEGERAALAERPPRDDPGAAGADER